MPDLVSRHLIIRGMLSASARRRPITTLDPEITTPSASGPALPEVGRLNYFLGQAVREKNLAWGEVANENASISHQPEICQNQIGVWGRVCFLGTHPPQVPLAEGGQ
jgi:hypothetical protein